MFLEFRRACLDYSNYLWFRNGKKDLAILLTVLTSCVDPRPAPTETTEDTTGDDSKKKRKDIYEPILRKLVEGKKDGIRIWKDTILNVNANTARRIYHAGMVDRYRTSFIY